MIVQMGRIKWRLLSRIMLWLYRRNLPWQAIPYLFMLGGFALGGLAAIVLFTRLLGY